ncbi:MAG TPA: MFS transporter [Phenylobacterium sp.]|jgi:Na+/melibiose symporter-like transporter
MSRSELRPALAPPPLRFPAKLSYGLGSIAYGVSAAALAPSVLQLYFNQVIGIPAVLVGVAIMVSLMADVVLDPLIGRWSDHFRSRWGRRHPFMYAAALPAAAFFYLIWHAPKGLEPGEIMVLAVVMLIGVRISVASFEIASNALAPELAPDYNERTSLLAYRWFFAISTLAVVTIVLLSVFLRQDAANPLGVLNRERYSQFATMAAIVVFVSILVSTAATHNRIKYLHQPPVVRMSMGEVAREILAAVKHPGLLVVMGSGVLGGTGVGITSALSNYFYLHLWHLKPQAIGPVALGGLLASVVGIVVAPMISRRFGKKGAMVGLFTVSIITSMIPIGGWVLGVIPAVKDSPGIYALLFTDVLVSAALGLMGIVILTSMVADVATDHAAKSGARSEGLLFAANGLVAKFTVGLGALVAGVLITFVGFPTHAVPGTVDPAIVRHLAILYLPCIVIFNGGSVVVLLFYKLDRTTHEHNLERLAEAAAIAEQAHITVGTTPVPETAG